MLSIFRCFVGTLWLILLMSSIDLPGQIPTRPADRPAPRPVPNAPSAPKADKAEVVVTWEGSAMVKIEIDKDEYGFRPGESRRLALRSKEFLSLSVILPAGRYSAKEFLEVSRDGGVLIIRMDETDRTPSVKFEYKSEAAIQEKKRLEAKEQERQLALEKKRVEEQKNRYNEAMKAGESKFNSGNYDDAIVKFETALKIFPNDRNASDYLKKAKEEAAWQQAKNAQYIEVVEAYADSYPYGKYIDDANDIIKHGYIFIAQKAYQESNETQLVYLYNRYQKRFPRDTDIEIIKTLLLDIYFNSAESAYLKKERSKAKEYYNKHLELSPNSIQATYCQEQINMLTRKEKRRETWGDIGFVMYILGITGGGVVLGLVLSGL
jgi:tetratricopeptide (TPR) repeat protein